MENKLISQDENGVIWIDSKDVIFGIVSATEVIGTDGAVISEDAFAVFDEFDFVLHQDWENGATHVEFIESNGETSKILFSDGEVSII